MRFFKVSRKQVLVAVAATLSVLGGIFVYGLNNKTEASTSNDIMTGGFLGASNPRQTFIDKVRSSNGGLNPDIQKIYADSRYGLTSDQYDRFATKAYAGKINPDTGNITVNGVTVGRDAQSLGRNQKPGGISTPVVINGVTYWQSPIRLLTQYENDALVLFDANGNVRTVVMNLCGNPMTVTPNNPKYQCDALNVTPSDRDTYKFSSVIAASNGATVTKVVYDFGDGQTSTQTSPSTVVEHTYAKPGNYTAKVTAYVKTTFGDSEFPITVTANCQKPVPVAVPENPTIGITKSVGAEGTKTKEVPLNTNFPYILKVTNTGNVDIASATVTDPAPAGVKFMSTDKGTIENNALKLAAFPLAKGQSITITITAQLTQYTSNAVENKACVQVPNLPEKCDTATITTPAPKTPHVKIEKTVGPEMKETLVVNKDTNFIYTIKVTNDGEVDLKDVVVSDAAQTGIQFISAKAGTTDVSVEGNKINHTIANLPVGQSVTIVITAKATQYAAAPVVNKACVETPTVPGGNPDACDTASTTTPEPNMVSVCNPETRTIIQVPEADKDKYLPVDSPKCEKIEVCVIDSGDTTLKPIFKDQFDASKHSTNPEDCKKPVTPPAPTQPTPTTPAVIPSTGPETVVGGLASASALTYGAYTYVASRRAVRNAHKM